MKLNENHDNAIQLEDIKLKFNNDFQIFDNLSLQIPKNSFNLILGPTGSGKSSLFSLIDGYIPYIEQYKVQGDVFIFGEKKSSLNALNQKKRIGIMGQHPEMQFIGNTVEDDLVFNLENKGIDPKQIKNEINEIEGIFPIIKKIKKNTPDTLSGGMLTIVAFINCILSKSDIILLDEPLTGLDFRTEKIFLDYLTKLKNKLTILIATHQIDPFIPLVDNFFVIKKEKMNFQFYEGEEMFFNDIDSYDWLEIPFKLKYNKIQN